MYNPFRTSSTTFLARAPNSIEEQGDELDRPKGKPHRSRRQDLSLRDAPDDVPFRDRSLA